MADHSPIYLDESQYGIVSRCTEHDWWSSFRFYRDDAYAAMCAHEEREHAGDYRVRNAAQMRARRRVEASSV